MSNILIDLIANKYKFAAKKKFNDLWVEINLDSPEQEIGFANTIQTQLGLNYGPLRNANMKKHC